MTRRRIVNRTAIIHDADEVRELELDGRAISIDRGIPSFDDDDACGEKMRQVAQIQRDRDDFGF